MFITTHFTVDGPVEQVWQALTDLEGYASCKPFIAAGPESLTFPPGVTAVEEHRYLD